MFAMFYAMILSDIRKSKIANVIMVVFLILVVANQYLPLFGITI
jgi:Flp pilus assembly protein protease CpaA